MKGLIIVKMSKKFEDGEINREFAEDVWNASKSFASGIYIPSDAHPCGWDFVSLEYYECSDDVEEQPIEDYEISNGYGSEEYADCTLLEILKKVHGQIAFEKNQIDWL